MDNTYDEPLNGTKPFCRQARLYVGNNHATRTAIVSFFFLHTKFRVSDRHQYQYYHCTGTNKCFFHAACFFFKEVAGALLYQDRK
jgi:CDP-glycerol glycerophosphotransferase (TagB/SpsB family)